MARCGTTWRPAESSSSQATSLSRKDMAWGSGGDGLGFLLCWNPALVESPLYSRRGQALPRLGPQNAAGMLKSDSPPLCSSPLPPRAAAGDWSSHFTEGPGDLGDRAPHGLGVTARACTSEPLPSAQGRSFPRSRSLGVASIPCTGPGRDILVNIWPRRLAVRPLQGCHIPDPEP